MTAIPSPTHISRRIRRGVVVATVAVLTLAGLAGLHRVGGAHAAPSTAEQALQADLDAILADPSLSGGSATVTVADSNGTVLYGHDPDRRYNPASTLKLLTSAAAIDILGSGFRFDTDVAAVGRARGGILAGNLYLRGHGDPTLLAEDLDGLAAKVAGSGIRFVTGSLIADESYFDTVRLGVGWAWDDEPYYYSQQASALTLSPNTDYDNGNVIVNTAPTRVGAPARLSLQPATGVVHLVNRTRTVAGTTDSIDVERDHGSNTIVVTGDIGAAHAVDQEWATVWDPAVYTADVFARALARHGVRLLRPIAHGTTPTSARPVADHKSAPLSEIYTPFLKLSNNGHAEAITKTLGAVVKHEGTWDAGVSVIADRLAQWGLDPSAIQQVDGSGLSRFDQVPSEQIVRLLTVAQHKPWFAAWYNALPIACNPDRIAGGTLRNRLCNTPAAGMHGKTGSLTGVDALAGYITDADGKRLIFSVILNNFVKDWPDPVIDRVAVRLAQYRADAGAARQPAYRPSYRGPVWHENQPGPRTHG